MAITSKTRPAAISSKKILKETPCLTPPKKLRGAKMAPKPRAPRIKGEAKTTVIKMSQGAMLTIISLIFSGKAGAF